MEIRSRLGNVLRENNVIEFKQLYFLFLKFSFRLLIYEFSDKLRIHIKELLKEAETKYNDLLEEKGTSITNELKRTYSLQKVVLCVCCIFQVK